MFNFKGLVMRLKNFKGSYNKKMDSPTNEFSNCVYICDGCNESCGINPEYCFKNGGSCTHTSNINHSIKLKLGDKFPSTYFVKCQGDLIAEEIDLKEFLQLFV